MHLTRDVVLTKAEITPLGTLRKDLANGNGEIGGTVRTCTVCGCQPGNVTRDRD